MSFPDVFFRESPVGSPFDLFPDDMLLNCSPCSLFQKDLTFGNGGIYTVVIQSNLKKNGVSLKDIIHVLSLLRRSSNIIFYLLRTQTEGVITGSATFHQHLDTERYGTAGQGKSMPRWSQVVNQKQSRPRELP